MKTIRLLVLALLMVTPAFAADLYVAINDPDCDNSTSRAANSAAAPWCHLARAAWGSTNRSSPNTSECARAGDVVHAMAGTYRTSSDGEGGSLSNAEPDNGWQPIYNPALSGTAGSPITFVATGGRVILESTPNSNEASGEPVIGAKDRSHIVWTGDGGDGWWYIDERNIDMRRGYASVVVHMSSFVEISYVEVNGMTQNWGSENHNGIRLEHTTNIELHNNLLYGIKNSPSSQNSAAIMSYATSHGNYHHNEIFDSATGIWPKGGESPEGAHNIDIHHNLIYDIAEKGIIAKSMHANGEAAYVRQNVVYNCGTFCMYIYGDDSAVDGLGPEDAVIANNTFYHCPDRGMYLNAANRFDNIRFFNNIFMDVNGSVIYFEGGVGDITFDYNNYYDYGGIASGNSSLSSWQSSGYDPHSVVTNPRFANAAGHDFRLCTGSGLPAAGCSGASPALNLGLDILDLDGDGSTTDRIPAGAYITADDIIGTGGEGGGGGSSTTPPGTVTGLDRADTYPQ